MIGTLVKEAALDGQYIRFAFIVFAPALICISAFACNCVIGSVVSYHRCAIADSSSKSSVPFVKSPRTQNTILV
jgi:hypothetical protein